MVNHKKIKEVKINEWEPESFENELLEAYWKEVRGIIYLEVPVGGSNDKWPGGSKNRWIDGVRVYGDGIRDFKVVSYPKYQEEFTEVIKENKVDIIEVKNKLNRPVIGQVIAGADMFERHYGVKPDMRTVVYLHKDPALRWVCEERGINLYKVGLK